MLQGLGGVSHYAGDYYSPDILDIGNADDAIRHHNLEMTQAGFQTTGINNNSSSQYGSTDAYQDRYMLSPRVDNDVDLGDEARRPGALLDRGHDFHGSSSISNADTQSVTEEAGTINSADPADMTYNDTRNPSMSSVDDEENAMTHPQYDSYLPHRSSNCHLSTEASNPSPITPTSASNAWSHIAPVLHPQPTVFDQAFQISPVNAASGNGVPGTSSPTSFGPPGDDIGTPGVTFPFNQDELPSSQHERMHTEPANSDSSYGRRWSIHANHGSIP
ncbi:hypothetical protein M426DRAFT_15912 [Hypoxylon sp. CI-4A]|nr:hypothetical protein M426DRAFT_15912 [Hypoxylon sp. CI-4A]